MVYTSPSLSESEMTEVAEMAGLARRGQLWGEVKGHVLTQIEGCEPVEAFLPDW